MKKRKTSGLSSFEMLKANDIDFTTIIDVGVGDHGTPVLMELYPNAKHILLECDKEVFDDIDKIYTDLQIPYELIKVKVDEFDPSLNNILKHYKHEWDRPCLLKIDIDGLPLQVVRGAVDLFPHIDWIMIETTIKLNRLYNKLKFLSGEQNWALWDIVDLHYGYGRLAQVDLLFCRPEVYNELAQKRNKIYTPIQI
jgi:hypothetical protein